MSYKLENNTLLNTSVPNRIRFPNTREHSLATLLDSAYISAGRATPPRVSAPMPPAAPTVNANKELNIPSAGLPKGVTLQLWNVMTPEEKAAFK